MQILWRVMTASEGNRLVANLLHSFRLVRSRQAMLQIHSHWRECRWDPGPHGLILRLRALSWMRAGGQAMLLQLHAVWTLRLAMIPQKGMVYNSSFMCETHCELQKILSPGLRAEQGLGGLGEPMPNDKAR